MAREIPEGGAPEGVKLREIRFGDLFRAKFGIWVGNPCMRVLDGFVDLTDGEVVTTVDEDSPVTPIKQIILASGEED